MKKSDHLTWTQKAQEAHNSLKNMVKSPPILTARHDALPPIFTIFQKSKLLCQDRLHERKFFWTELDLERSKGDGLLGVRPFYSFKAPSTYTFVATTGRLVSTARVLKSLSDLFSKALW
jgi:hypothetical protein